MAFRLVEETERLKVQDQKEEKKPRLKFNTKPRKKLVFFSVFQRKSITRTFGP